MQLAHPFYAANKFMSDVSPTYWPHNEWHTVDHELIQWHLIDLTFLRKLRASLMIAKISCAFLISCGSQDLEQKYHEIVSCFILLWSPLIYKRA